MAEVKPGLESEQQDDEDGRETQEGTAPPRSSPASSFMASAKHAHLCVTLHPGCSHIRWGGGHHISHQACRGRR